MFGEFETKLTEDGNWTLMHIRVFHDIYITKTENHYKRSVYEKVLKGDLILSIKEHNTFDKKEKPLIYFILEIKCENETVFVRSNNRLPLEYICYHVKFF